MEKKLRKFFPFSKFTKLVNLLVLETQGMDRWKSRGGKSQKKEEAGAGR